MVQATTFCWGQCSEKEGLSCELSVASTSIHWEISDSIPKGQSILAIRYNIHFTSLLPLLNFICFSREFIPYPEFWVLFSADTYKRKISGISHSPCCHRVLMLQLKFIMTLLLTSPRFSSPSARISDSLGGLPWRVAHTHSWEFWAPSQAMWTVLVHLTSKFCKRVSRDTLVACLRLIHTLPCFHME